jgi:hypothetical protein
MGEIIRLKVADANLPPVEPAEVRQTRSSAEIVAVVAVGGKTALPIRRVAEFVL